MYVPGIQNLDPSRLQQTVTQSLAGRPVEGEELVAWAYGLDNNWLNVFKARRGARVLLVVTNCRFIVLHPSKADTYSIESMESFRLDQVNVGKRKKPSFFQYRFFAALSTPTHVYNLAYSDTPRFVDLSPVLDYLEEMRSASSQTT
jgi:hypothetical protein